MADGARQIGMEVRGVFFFMNERKNFSGDLLSRCVSLCMTVKTKLGDLFLPFGSFGSTAAWQSIHAASSSESGGRTEDADFTSVSPMIC